MAGRAPTHPIAPAGPVLRAPLRPPRRSGAGPGAAGALRVQYPGAGVHAGQLADRLPGHHGRGGGAAHRAPAVSAVGGAPHPVLSVVRRESVAGDGDGGAQLPRGPQTDPAVARAPGVPLCRGGRTPARGHGRPDQGLAEPADDRVRHLRAALVGGELVEPAHRAGPRRLGARRATRVAPALHRRPGQDEGAGPDRAGHPRLPRSRAERDGPARRRAGTGPRAVGAAPRVRRAVARAVHDGHRAAARGDRAAAGGPHALP